MDDSDVAGDEGFVLTAPFLPVFFDDVKTSTVVFSAKIGRESGLPAFFPLLPLILGVAKLSSVLVSFVSIEFTERVSECNLFDLLVTLGVSATVVSEIEDAKELLVLLVFTGDSFLLTFDRVLAAGD